MHVEANIRFLTTQEGGRKTPVRSGYAAQFYVDDQNRSVHLTFPDLQPREQIVLGKFYRASLVFLDSRKFVESLTIGTQFKIKEGARTVATGEITQRGDYEVS